MDQKLLNDVLYSNKTYVRNGELYCNGKKITGAERIKLLSEPIVKYSEIISEYIDKYQAKNISKNHKEECEETISFFITTLIIMYERIYSKYDESGIFREEKGYILDLIESFKKDLGKDYNLFFVKSLLRKGKATLSNLKTAGLEDIDIANFPMLFETFYDKPDNVPNKDVFNDRKKMLYFIMSLSGEKGVLKYLIDNDYVSKEECESLFSEFKENLWQFYYYGVALDEEDVPSIKPLPRSKREDYLIQFMKTCEIVELYYNGELTAKELLEVSEILEPTDFIYMYKKGDINIQQLANKVNFYNLVNSTYSLSNMTDEERNVYGGITKEEIENDVETQQILSDSFLSEDELITVLSSKEYRKKVDNSTSDIIWLGYLSRLISIDNLKKLEQMNTNSSYKYLDIYNIISKYQDYKKHLIIERLEVNEQDKNGLREYFSFEKMVEMLDNENSNSQKQNEVVDFFNTIIRKIYSDEGVDFENGLIEEECNQSSIYDKDEKIIKLYDLGLISAENLFKTEIDSEKLVDYYVDLKKKSKECKTSEDKEKMNNKADIILYKLSDRGNVDLIDIIDVLQRIDEDYDKDEDTYINEVCKMVSNKQVSTNVIYEFFREDKKENSTMQLLEKFYDGVLNAESVKQLSALFDYGLIQKLYNDGSIKFDELKDILGDEKAKEMDEKYDVFGKLEDLKKKGGIKGIEVEHEKTGRKKVPRGGKKQVHNIDEDTKILFYNELANLDKEGGMQDDEVMAIEINAPVFKGFVLYAMPNFGIGFMEGDNGSTFTVRLKEVLEEADRAYSNKNVIGSSRSRKEFALDNPEIVKRTYHSANWAKMVVQTASELASRNSDKFRMVLDRRLKTDNERILNMRKMIVDIKSEYSKNLKKRKESQDFT